jgi:hypothetical protein
MSHRRGFCVVATVVTLSMGCSKTNSDGTSSEDLAIQQACALDAQAFCDKRKTCWPAGVQDFRFQRDWGDLAGCVAQRKTTCLADLQRKHTGLSAVRTEGCAHASEQQSCPDFLAGLALPTPQCPAAGSGDLDNGGTCAVSAQCRSAYCNRSEFEPCGRCADRGGIGTTCDQNGDCVSGLTCVLDASGTTGTCMSPAPPTVKGKVGEACGATGQPACDTGLTCVGTGAMRTCQAQLTTAGAPCDATRRKLPDCDGALYLSCNRTTAICEPQKLMKIGEPCNDLADGSFGVCTSGSACVRPRDPATNNRPAAGTCVADVTEGMPCARSAADGPGCAPSLRCVYDALGAPTGRCHAQDLTMCAAAAPAPAPDAGRD